VIGTLARTVEPGEKETPPNFKEAPAAAAPNVEKTLSVTKIQVALSNLFKDNLRKPQPTILALLDFVESRRLFASAI